MQQTVNEKYAFGTIYLNWKANPNVNSFYSNEMTTTDKFSYEKYTTHFAINWRLLNEAWTLQTHAQTLVSMLLLNEVCISLNARRNCSWNVNLQNQNRKQGRFINIQSIHNWQPNNTVSNKKILELNQYHWIESPRNSSHTQQNYIKHTQMFHWTDYLQAC